LKRYILTILILCISFQCGIAMGSDVGEDDLFFTIEERDRFAREISDLIVLAWKDWQDDIVINGVYVEGSTGFLLPGRMDGPVLTSKNILKGFSRKGRSSEYSDCVKAVAGAVAQGVRSWQRGYGNDNIPFPQGASCVYTLTPCDNMPVTVSSGYSSGDKDMERFAIYNYLIYRIPENSETVIQMFKIIAKAISQTFEDWKNTCLILDINASGGIAPQPAPMGSGPGPVKGAKGKGGNLTGGYFDGELMYRVIKEQYDSILN
jgi:hypothetical protein